ncbi:MAG: type II toxin-antitoxin system HicA family toxin [Cyanobacteria bacterium P01_F01_bin.33]
MRLNSKQRKTLQDVFDDPVKSDIKWSDIESLVLALGGTLKERRGSRVSIRVGGVSRIFHRPHPSPNTVKAAVRDFRRLLQEADISPNIGGQDDHDN